VSSNGFEQKAYAQQKVLLSNGIPLQLWGPEELIQRAQKLPNTVPNTNSPREYQEDAIKGIVGTYIKGKKKALVVMATGLGKTFVAAESLRRIYNLETNTKVLVLAHTNPLVYQLERSFWKFMTKEQTSTVWNGYESPRITDIERTDIVFACVDTVFNHIKKYEDFPKFDVIIVDECHHAGSNMYKTVLDFLHAGQDNGSFLLGLTATPWRPDEVDLGDIFGEMIVCIDMVDGLRKGFLSAVDYRIYTDNIDWESLKNLEGQTFTPAQINRTLFIEQWDDAVVYELKKAWLEQSNPRAIVFCGTIDHANIMCSKLNALGFCKAAAIYSNSSTGDTLNQFEKNRILSDFSDGIINVVCTVDIFNEGIDVPDVNIIVFQRVTHSRRIFIQQLGRGLRISDDKDKVIVLDFVNDIRRFANDMKLKDDLAKGTQKATRISLPNKVTFRKQSGEDPETEQFLRIWLDDIAEIEQAGENSSILKFPPVLPHSKK